MPQASIDFGREAVAAAGYSFEAEHDVPTTSEDFSQIERMLLAPVKEPTVADQIPMALSTLFGHFVYPVSPASPPPLGGPGADDDVCAPLVLHGAFLREADAGRRSRRRPRVDVSCDAADVRVGLLLQLVRAPALVAARDREGVPLQLDRRPAPRPGASASFAFPVGAAIGSLMTSVRPVPRQPVRGRRTSPRSPRSLSFATD